jgi:uncharacterized protein YkwD
MPVVTAGAHPFPLSGEAFMNRVGRSLLAVVLLTGVAWAQDQAPRHKDEPAVKLSTDEQKVLDLTNEARKKKDLPPLKPNPTLMKVARAHSADMAKQQKMEHELSGKNPADRAKAAGYDYRALGENIAEAPRQMAVEKVFDLWMNSPHHRDNILSRKFEEIGVGLATDDKGQVYYTQEFGTRRKNQ